MRAIIQRVKNASVTVDNEVISEIDQGLLVFLGVTHDDATEDVDYIASKIVNLRIFTDEEDKMNLSLKDVDGQILVVSQFTLYGDARKGRRPSFTNSAGGDFAEDMYQQVINSIENEGFDVKTGIFGADMDISLINDGPVTIQLDSSKIY